MTSLFKSIADGFRSLNLNPSVRRDPGIVTMPADQLAELWESNEPDDAPGLFAAVQQSKREPLPPHPMIEFLLARIAEDEAAVKARGSWWPDSKMDGETVWAWRPMDERDHREATAKRLLVEGVRAMREDRAGLWIRPDWFDSESKWHGDAPYVLRCVALPYAEHPDYREEWKP